MQKFEECLDHIRENHLTESEAISALKNTGLNIHEAYKVCLNEFKSFNKEELRAAVMDDAIKKIPLVGYYNEYGITVLPSEEEED